MTATHVNGVEVIADEPTPSPITTRDGGTVLWHQTRTLLLADGSTVYGCQHCDYTNERATSIRPHLNKHRDTNGKTATATGDLTLQQLVARLGDYDKVAGERDDWKRRALDAEGKLRTLRKALGVARG